MTGFITWRIDKPLKEIRIYGDNDEYSKVPKEMLDKDMKVRKGDSVALLYNDDIPMFTEPIKGTTFVDILQAIERGANRAFKKNHVENLDVRETVYGLIARFLHGKERVKLVTQFENYKLKVKDLMGDYVWFEGGLKRGKGGIWIYALGS